MLLGRISNSTFRVFLFVVRNSAVPVLLEASLINEFVKVRFPFVRKTAVYNSKPIPIPVLPNLPGKHNKRMSIRKTL